MEVELRRPGMVNEKREGAQSGPLTVSLEGHSPLFTAQREAPGCSGVSDVAPLQKSLSDIVCKMYTTGRFMHTVREQIFSSYS